MSSKREVDIERGKTHSLVDFDAQHSHESSIGKKSHEKKEKKKIKIHDHHDHEQAKLELVTISENGTKLKNVIDIPTDFDLHSFFQQFRKHHHHNRDKGDRKSFHQKLWKTPKETFVAITQAATKKSQMPIDKLFILGVLSGIYIGFGGVFALTVSMGSPSLDPGVQKLLLGITFPIALFCIIFMGGELFTGNVMYSTAGFLAGTISFKNCFVICGTAYFSNFVGCVLGGYFFGYLTDVFAADPWHAGIQKIAVAKTSMGFGVIFLRAIAANWLVNIAIFVVISAEDISGKVMGLFYPICAFAVSGFEHCVANMFFVCLGLMYGADTTFGKFLYANLIPATLGNIVGGGIMVGAVSFYVYGWRIPKDEIALIKKDGKIQEKFVEVTCCL